MRDKTLQKARQDWFSSELKNLKLLFPVVEIAKETGYSNTAVSDFITSKRSISVEFMRKFCETYNYDFDAVNHTLIDKIKDGIQKNDERKTSLTNAKDKRIDLSLQPTKNQEDMQNFMKGTIEWQRQVIDALITKLPDIEKPDASEGRDRVKNSA